MRNRRDRPYGLVDMGRGLQVLATLVIISVLYSILAQALAQILGSHFLSPTQARLGNLVLSGCLLFGAVVALRMNLRRADLHFTGIKVAWRFCATPGQYGLSMSWFLAYGIGS